MNILFNQAYYLRNALSTSFNFISSDNADVMWLSLSVTCSLILNDHPSPFQSSNTHPHPYVKASYPHSTSLSSLNTLPSHTTVSSTSFASLNPRSQHLTHHTLSFHRLFQLGTAFPISAIVSSCLRFGKAAEMWRYSICPVKVCIVVQTPAAANIIANVAKCRREPCPRREASKSLATAIAKRREEPCCRRCVAPRVAAVLSLLREIKRSLTASDGDGEVLTISL